MVTVLEELDIWGNPVTRKHPFKWALDVLQTGGRVRRPHWGEGCYIRVNEHNILVRYRAKELTAARALRETRYDLEWSEMIARDWEGE